MLSSDVPDRQALHRRTQLRALDAILGELETMNLRGIEGLPQILSARLRSAGVAHRDGAPVSEIIDLVFKVQEAYLRRTPSSTAPRRTAA